MKSFSIINYKPEYQQDYKLLSLEWLNENNLYEDADGLMLDFPKREVLNKGGFIFLAKVNEQITGTVTLLPTDNNTYEILKLGVNKNYQRIGIGRSLVEYCIDEAKKMDAKKIILETSSKLENAIRLYSKLGFKKTTLQNTKFELSDIKMELLLH
ncbi:MAG: GNAT family N-acetyltransferase [Saprospiraceae bacterium]|nr:GNAT family N-acetyltransferase [Saprospiraceae bacterium]